MLIATAAELASRRLAIEGSPALAGLSRRLRTLVQPLLARPPAVPDRKAMLSQDGGVCPDDGSRLEFDPLSPDAHRCPRCHKALTGERHHLAWLMRYHIWLSERAVHLALLGALDHDARLTAQANEILKGYAWRYAGYPNRDNVLGPTRLFFSTYLESIWLIQVSIAASLTGADVREMVAESAGIIRSYDEGSSNRQVWNNAAMIAAGRLLGDPALVSHGLDGPHGIRAQLSSAVTPDGSWFEGQNYHFFALRGMQLAAELLRGGGVDLYADAGVGLRLSAMYTAPLQSLLPDLTIPARSDSPYGVSVRQPRFAELWEVARVRTGDERIAALLAELYRGDLPEGDDPGLAEVSEVEQNRPAARLSRERLGWKALLWMNPAEPASGKTWEPGSSLSPDHGLVVLRSGGRYVSLECGGRPGGHGHPDLLHLSLYWGQPWLMDFGTGSYVSPSLFWYRSTLAHNAPGVAGSGQLVRDGRCMAFDQSDGWAWCSAVATDVFRGSSASRTVVVGPDYVLDVVDVIARDPVDLPIHPLGDMVLPAGIERRGATLKPDYAAGQETGYDRLVRCDRLSGTLRRFSTRQQTAELTVTLAPRAGEEVYVGAASGPPDLHLAETGPLEFLVRRARGQTRWVQTYALDRNAVRDLDVTDTEIRVLRGDGQTDTVRFEPAEVANLPGLGPREALVTAGGRSIQLRGYRHPSPVPEPDAGRAPLTFGTGTKFVLGAGHYRRSEVPYDAALFRATVDVSARGRFLLVAVRVQKPELIFRRATEPDPRLDNEPADIHSDGVQCYFGLDAWQGYLLVPDLDSDLVRVRAVAGTAAVPTRVSAKWVKSAGGYQVDVQYDLGHDAQKGERIPFNVVVNEMIPGRQRRAGQLALSGGGGWVYLRGDRESPETAVLLEVR